MKKILILTYLIGFCSLIVLANDIITADEFYDQADYENAVQLYKSALVENPSSAELWYNLGNAYYKSGELGYAIAAYRKAHKLDPMDEDIRFNLNYVFAKTTDKIEPKPKSFIVRQTDIVADMFTSSGWAVGAVLVAILAFAAFVLYIFMKNYNIKRFGLLTAIFFWCISFLFVAMAAHRYYYSLDSFAVIIKPNADVLAEPNNNGTRLLMLNEGATLELKKREADWIKVQLPNGTIGYISSQAVEVI